MIVFINFLLMQLFRYLVAYHVAAARAEEAERQLEVATGVIKKLLEDGEKLVAAMQPLIERKEQ